MDDGQGADRPAPDDQRAESNVGAWVFYVVVVVMIVAEGLIVRTILSIATWLGQAKAGPMLAWLAFVVGGGILGFIELALVRTGQRLRDPVLRACCYLQRKLGLVGFVINATLIGGAPGSAVALRHVDHPRKRTLTAIAAVLFATVWVPFFVWFWR